ncbi:predicted protein [Plenodomus lingam JN3]|uniref:Predicted protein n=1 Tax=Leptosphaeria maculans (strain JN3 / isolate v23.1.3 / race Av1-4-5-6-7-8) TaxID=985895 RepID=E4ZMG0_LEPMJ|nr:predicted protein [Plenodomus lingam JN3]CBX92829.1 predicted protein [Plenodomus lingam JN3]
MCYTFFCTAFQRSVVLDKRVPRLTFEGLGVWRIYYRFVDCLATIRDISRISRLTGLE